MLHGLNKQKHPTEKDKWMRAILQINRSLAKKPGMGSSDKAVSKEALEQEWVEIQAAQIDPAAFRPLYERHFEPLFRFVFRRTADEHLTADLVSQVFLKALQNLSGYAFKGVPFSAWLFRIALNEVAMFFREHHKNRVVCLDDQAAHELWTDVDYAHLETDLEPLLKALDQLPLNDLQLIELRYFEKRPYREIADLLELTENNAKVKVHRIIARLRRTLENDG